MSGGDQRLETERLALRAPRLEDLDAYLGLFFRPEVRRWLRPPPLDPFDEAEIRGLLDADRRHWAERGYGLWMVLDRKDGDFLGRAGVRREAVEGEAVEELVWTIDPDRQRRGLATEAARAAIGMARDQGVGELVAMTLPRNWASRRVAEKLGMAEAGEIERAGLPHVLYRLRLAG